MLRRRSAMFFEVNLLETRSNSRMKSWFTRRWAKTRSFSSFRSSSLNSLYARAIPSRRLRVVWKRLACDASHGRHVDRTVWKKVDRRSYLLSNKFSKTQNYYERSIFTRLVYAISCIRFSKLYGTIKKFPFDCTVRWPPRTEIFWSRLIKFCH